MSCGVVRTNPVYTVNGMPGKLMGLPFGVLTLSGFHFWRLSATALPWDFAILPPGGAGVGFEHLACGHTDHAPVPGLALGRFQCIGDVRRRIYAFQPKRREDT